MGEPVDGTLFYGYCWNETIEFGDEIEDHLARLALVREAVAQCEIGWCGNEYHEKTYVYIVGTEQTAGQFNPEPVDIGKAFTSHAANHRWWGAMLDTFLSQHNVEPPQGPNQPGWWLVSRYCG